MVFLPGDHTFDVQANITSITGFSMLRESEGTSRIICSGSGCGGFYFEKVLQLDITNLTFISDSQSITVAHVFDVRLVNCMFANSSNTAVIASDSGLLLEGNMFRNNSGGGVDWMTFKPGGGISVVFSNITLRGQNIFQNNTCISNTTLCGGGAMYAENSTVNLEGNSSFINNAVRVSKGVEGVISGGGGLLLLRTTIDITGDVHFTNNSVSNAVTVEYGCTCGGGGASMWSCDASVSGDVTFSSNVAVGESGCGGGMYVYRSSVNVTESVVFVDNHAGNLGGGIMTFDSNLSVSGSLLLTGNSGDQGGGLNIQHDSNFDDITGSNLNITGTVALAGNSAGFEGGGIMTVYSNVSVSGTLLLTENSGGQGGGGLNIHGGSVDITGTVELTNNSAKIFGGGIGMSGLSYMSVHGNLLFTDNSGGQDGGGLNILGSSMDITGTMLLTNNSAIGGGGICMTIGTLNITGSIVLTSNHADTNGGGMSLDSGSQMAITGSVYFIENTAISGGAIYVIDDSTLLYCASVAMVTNCFFQVDTSTSDKLLVFEGNMAESGSVLYGGSIDRCTLEGDPEANSGEVFDRIANISEQVDTMSVISSSPFRICLCDGHQVCTATNGITGTTYPGQTISVRVAAVGQRNGTHPATVNAITNPSELSHLDAFQYYQQVTNCTELNYTTFSTGTYLLLQLYVDGSCSSFDVLKNRLFITVYPLPCPRAFTLSESTQGCICEERLRKYTNSCDINYQTIERDGDFWVGYDDQSSGLILHPHCPFDYCKTKPIRFTLNDTDRQCKGDRSGLLCGACQSNRSLALGSSRCLSCSDAYLSLLVPFAVMGVVLVIFLLACRLTVALGTLSGLVFYANIVQANRSAFFPPGSSNPLTVFIAWVNLDLGIETCFYDGMDAYAKTWLQFAFPIYIWGVIGIIMFISSRSVTISRILGKNPVAILATLFLLSYAKILRTIITALSLTTLQYPNESQVVWLNDANIRYLEGKHIPLFVVGLLVFVLLFLPYTLLLLFGQWLLAWSNLKILFWMNNTKLKAFFDSYYSPYEEKHRYWTGLLLVVRFVLLLVFGTNVLGEDSENLLAISAASFGLLAWPWLMGTVYKSLYLSALEASFILNLGISAVANIYIQQAGGSQAIVAYMSTGIAFATFIAILLYHIDLQIKVSQFLKTFCCRRGDQQPGNEREREILVLDAGGRALDVQAGPYYGSSEFREPLLDEQ